MSHASKVVVHAVPVFEPVPVEWISERKGKR